MNSSARREAPLPDSPLGRVLPLLLPALVHRLNNALTSIQLVLELDTPPGSRERGIALEDARTMRSILLQLVALVEPRSGEQELDLAALVRSVARVLAPMAERAGVALDVRVPAGALAACVPGEFGSFLAAHVVDLLAVREARARTTRVRVSARAGAGHARVLVTTDAPASPLPPTSGAGRVRSSRGARSLVLTLDLLGVPPPDGLSGARAAGLRVLVLQRDRDQRLVTEELLRQRGHRVVGGTSMPEADEFDVVLADADLAPGAPGLLEALRADPRLCRARILPVGRWARGADGLTVLDAPPRPALLLEAVERS